MGRQFDKEGLLNNWWDSVTDKNFKLKSQCIIDQYNNYTIEAINMNLNGINSLGENIADIEGVKQAFLAYKAYVEHNEEEKNLPGLKYTPKQLFWISFANTWCSKENIEYLKFKIEVQTHCPNKYRFN